jgi:hypothetical protein
VSRRKRCRWRLISPQVHSVVGDAVMVVVSVVC